MVIIQNNPVTAPGDDAKVLYDSLALVPEDSGHGTLTKTFALDQAVFGMSCQSSSSATSCTISIKAGSNAMISRKEGKIVFEATGDLAGALYKNFVPNDEGHSEFAFETNDKMATIDARPERFSFIYIKRK